MGLDLSGPLHQGPVLRPGSVPEKCGCNSEVHK